MVDVLKAVVDALSRLVPALAGKRRDAKLQQIGLRLFLVYVRLVECLVAADRIVHDLEYFARNPGDAELCDRLAHRLKKQAENVARLRNLLNENAEVLILLDAECYARLAPLLRIKLGFLHLLEAALGGGTLPLDCSDADLELHAEQAAALVAEGPERGAPLARRLTFSSDVGRSSQVLLDSRHTVRVTAPLGDARSARRAARMVKRYLAVRHPREEIGRLKDTAARLGATLSEHFSVEEALLRIGKDGRLDPA